MKRTLSALLLLTLLLSLCGCNNTPAPTTVPSTSSIPVVLNPTGPLYDRKSYTVAAGDAMDARLTAFGAVGDIELTNGILQVAYWTEFIGFLEAYAYFLETFGLDYSQPLDTQECKPYGGTWQQYFLKEALNAIHEYTAIIQHAQADGLPAPEAMDEVIAQVKTQLQEAATAAGHTDLDTYVQTRYGPGCTADDFYEYSRLSLLHEYYFDYRCSQLEITDQMIQDYYNANEKALNSSGITKDGVIVYNIRHILIPAEAADKDSTPTDADWNASHQKAQDLLDQWLAGDQTEEAFGKLAMTHSADPGSALNGGLYSGAVENSTFAQEFKDWYLADGRQPGDYGLVKTEFGWHIMYFSGTEEYWHYMCGQAVANIQVEALPGASMSRYPITLDYAKISLGLLDMDAYLG